MTRESDIETYLRYQAEAAGGEAWKWVSPGLLGVPDRIVLLPGGVVRFVELKAPGEKLRAAQERRHARLRDLGFDVRVVDSFENARRAVANAYGADPWRTGG